MVKTNFIATLMILQGFLFLYVQPWYFPYSCSYDNGNYNVSWTFNETSDRLYFKVEVNTTGWVGFGLANEAPTNMTDYDVAVGGVYDNGSCYLQDYLTIGWRQPQLDLQQDWKLINCSEDNGVTTLFFCRAKNTSDENDTVVEEGKSIYIIWAYHDTTDVTDMSFPKHTARGYDNKTLCPAETSTSTIISPSPTTSSVSSPTTSIVVNKKPGPTVTLTLKVTIACSGNVQTLNVSLQIDILGIYVKAGFSVKFVKTKSISCNSPLNMALDMSFYSPIPEGKTIQGVFEEALKNGSIRNLTTSNTEATFTFIGATVKYKPKAGQCKQVCCDGAGGEMIVVPECTPADKCEGILLKEKKEDGHCPKDSIGTCTVECDDDDSGGIHNSPNFAAVVLLAIATFVKTIFY
ncbi:uncharacterized protein LOC144649726 isoform X2 [Oculina patagonica]